MDLTLELAHEGIRRGDLIKALEKVLAETLEREGQFQEEAAIGDILDLLQGFYCPQSEDSELAIFLRRLECAMERALPDDHAG